MALLTATIAQGRADEDAIIDEFGATSWGELDLRVNRLVHALRSHGLGNGDHVAIIAGNRAEWFEIALACSHGGWTYVPVNWHWVADELAYVFEDAAPVAVFVDPRFVGPVVTALADQRSASVRLVVGLGSGSAGESCDVLSTDARFVGYDELITSGSADEPTEQRLGGPMFYTSGTTGRPKGVRGMLSGGGDLGPEIMQFIAASFKNFLPIPGRTLLCGPVYHSAQWAFSFLPLIGGSSVVMQHRYDSAELIDLIDRHQVTNVHFVPTQMKRLLDLGDDVKQRFNGSSMITVWHGAAP